MRLDKTHGSEKKPEEQKWDKELQCYVTDEVEDDPNLPVPHPIVHVIRGGEKGRALRPVWEMRLLVQGGLLRVAQWPDDMGANCSWPQYPDGAKIRAIVVKVLGYEPEDLNISGTRVSISPTDAKRLVYAIWAMVEGGFE